MFSSLQATPGLDISVVGGKVLKALRLVPTFFQACSETLIGLAQSGKTRKRICSVVCFSACLGRSGK